MRHRFFMALTLLTLCSSLIAQSTSVRTIDYLETADFDARTGLTDIREIPLTETSPFLSFFVVWEASELKLAVRFGTQADQWTDWQLVNRDEHATDKNISGLYLTEPEQRYFQLKILGNTEISGDIACHFYNPGRTVERPTSGGNTPEMLLESRACPCPFPSFLGRSQWCPDNSCPGDPTPVFTNVTHLIVHHSAGTNNASDWSAIVRAIYDLHVTGNGWDDIGYNWLIDPNGKVYLGRGDDLRGAHFCGHNTGTMGVCVLGNFTEVAPTITARSALKDLLSWKACDIGADPLTGSFHASSNAFLPHISGHRDGCATACPGDQFYPLLDEVREAAAYNIIAGCAGLPGPTALQADLIEEVNAQLSWVDNTSDEAGYLLERSMDDNLNYALIATLDPDTENYQDTALAVGATFFYRLRSYTATDTSAYSNEAVVTLNPSSTDPHFNQQSVRITPNPAVHQVEVEIQNHLMGELAVVLTAITGQQVVKDLLWQKSTETARYTLDISHLPRGVYLIRLQQGSHRGVFRLIKI